MRQLVAQYAPHVRVEPHAVVAVRPQTQLDAAPVSETRQHVEAATDLRLARVLVETEQIRVLVWRELRQHAHAELVQLHDVPHRRVVGQPA